MKKFLFTLAMLLMAGAAFADSYLYINKADVLTGEQYVEVPVKAHFSEYVSAWQVTITLPDGINFDGRADVGQDMTIPYFTDRGKTSTYTLSLSQNGVGGFLAASQQEGFYKLNGTWTSHGAIKWAPGDYDEMIILYLEVTDAYTGGDIMITTEPMSGADPRDIPKAVVDGGRTLPWVDETITAAEPTLAVDNEENPTQVTTNGVLYYCDETMTPGAWNIVTAPYTLPQATDVEQKLHFMAYTPNDEGKNDSKFVYLTVTIPAAAQEAAPAANITNVGNVVTAAVPDETAGTHNVELYIVTKDGEGNEVLTEVPNPYTVEQTFSEQKITFKALTKANEGESEDTWSEPKEITIDAKPDNQCPQPEFAYYQTPDNELWARVMYYGEAPYTEHVELYIVTTNDEGEEVLTPVDNPYKGLPTENNTFEDIVVKFKAIVKADGVNYNVDNYDYYTVTIPGKEDKQAPAPTFRVEGDKLYAEKDNLTVELYKKNDDGTWTKVDNPYEGLPTENTSYTEPIKIDFKAITLADGVTYNVNSDEATYTYELAPLNKKTAEKPTIVGTNLTNTTKDIVITPDPNTDGTLVVGANPAAPGRAAAQTMTYERKDADYYVHVKAWTTEGDTYLASEVAEEDILIPAKPAPEVIELPDPTISETHDAANQTTIITITVPENTPEGTVLNYTLTDEDGNVIPASDYTVTATDGKIVITIPNGAETAFVTVTATTTMPNAPEGVVVENGEATKTVEVPQYQQTAAPTIDVSFAGEEGHYYANVTFKNDPADPNAVIEYCLGDPTVEANWMTYTGAPVVITEDGPHTVYARATATGKATSEVADRTFELNQTATSVNELVNGKTVAGVRYFNMAGQEMQEANGITIVVTTYTDGTTTAVKVIK